ncbi:MAG: PDZ domain-containing protein [Candidatus Latescibacterota bacterium]|nr:MAG: PDZ domain-containing protein [Candidatus Latescibacterota bacterium]
MKGTKRTLVLPLLLLGTLIAAPLGAQEEGGSAWMGLYIRDLDSDDVESLGLERRLRGVVVSGVDDEGPAARAGIAPGDVITKFDGRSVRNGREFMRQLRSREPGESVRITVVRDSGPESYEFALEPRPRELERFRPYEFSIDAPGRLGRALQSLGVQLGVQTQDLDDPDLASYFGVEAGHGVLVTSVVKESGAEKAGIQGGDVIVSVDEESVENSLGLRTILAQHEVGDEVSVRLRRKNRERTVLVELTESLVTLSTLRLPGAPNLMRDEVGELRREIRDIRRELRRLERELNEQRGK